MKRDTRRFATLCKRDRDACVRATVAKRNGGREP